MAIETIPFDVSKYLKTPEAQAELLADAFNSGDAHYIAHAMGIIAKSKGMSNVAKKAGITREALYRALSKNGDPRLSTLIGVAKALDLQISVKLA